MIEILMADDHAIFRSGLRRLLSDEPDMRIVAEAANGLEAIEQLRKRAFGVVLLDVNMGGRSGFETLRRIHGEWPSQPVVMLSMYPEDQYALRCIKAGAEGYANKSGDPLALVEAVRTVASGRKYLTQEVAQMLAQSLAHPIDQAPHASLSEREMQTLQKIATGKRLTDIAQELMLSPKTVSVYRARVLEKLQLTNNAELTVYAIRNHLV